MTFCQGTVSVYCLSHYFVYFFRNVKLCSSFPSGKEKDLLSPLPFFLSGSYDSCSKLCFTYLQIFSVVLPLALMFLSALACNFFSWSSSYYSPSIWEKLIIRCKNKRIVVFLWIVYHLEATLMSEYPKQKWCSWKIHWCNWCYILRVNFHFSFASSEHNKRLEDRINKIVIGKQGRN